jgi:trans-aconitate methyltransferase
MITHYLEARLREARLLEDEVVKFLPDVSPQSPFYREWRMRKRSFQRFQTYLYARSSHPLQILDLGCGNGWMSNALAENPNWQVSAVDVNELELHQAKRLFHRPNLNFFEMDLSLWPTNPFPSPFDVIVLAASVQYFADLPALVGYLRTLLAPNGEIHVLDSPFYNNETLRAAARLRTIAYYQQLGVPEMAQYYYHHSYGDVLKAGGVDLNNSLKIKFLQKMKYLPPFPWIRF